MADKKVKAKLGETVTIEIARRKKAKQAPKKKQRRYGPPPIIDEDELRRHGKTTTIHFLNQESEFGQKFTFAPKNELKYQHDWTIPSLLLTHVSLAKSINVRHYFNSSDFVIYRQAWDKHPLPYANADDYNVALILGGQSKSLAVSNDEWKEYSPAAILADLLARQANGETGLESAITNAQYEVDEWAAAFESNETYWIEPNVSWHRAYGYYQKKLTRKVNFSLYSLGNFEPFDPYDTVNFKVTDGLYSAAAFPVPKLSNRRANDLRLGLFPKIWEYTIGYKAWHFQELFGSATDRLWLHNGTFNGISAAITLPYFENNRQTGNPNRGINKFEIKESNYSAGLFSSITTTSSSIETDGIPTPFDNVYLFRKIELEPFDSTSLQGCVVQDETFTTSDTDNPGVPRILWERSDCTITIRERDLSEGDLVGMIQINGDNLFVYRKTPVARGAVIYSGPYDSVISILTTQSATLGVPEFYPNRGWQSRSRDFSYFDPSNIYEHMTA